MNSLLGYLSRNQKNSVNQKVNLSTMYCVMLATIVVSYFSYMIFPYVYNDWVVKAVKLIGMSCVPAIRSAMAISFDPDRCAFVMSVQWLFLFIYIWLFLIFYCPFSKVVKIATKNWYIANPLPPSGSVRCILYLMIVLACICGDFGLLKFPTFYNGILFSLDSDNFLNNKIINSSVILPLFSWFSVFAYALIYWLAIFIIANRTSLFENQRQDR
jgi:hypothetical protein